MLQVRKNIELKNAGAATHLHSFIKSHQVIMKSKTLSNLQPFLIALLISFVLFSCEQQTSATENKEAPDEVKTLKQEVMGVHDEIMPGVGTLMNLKKQLKEKAAQLDTIKEADKVKAAAIAVAIKDLEEADEAMMQWMRTYQDPSLAEGKAKALEYLELKKNEILIVKRQMESSETAARSLLQIP